MWSRLYAQSLIHIEHVDDGCFIGSLLLSLLRAATVTEYKASSSRQPDCLSLSMDERPGDEDAKNARQPTTSSPDANVVDDAGVDLYVVVAFLGVVSILGSVGNVVVLCTFAKKHAVSRSVSTVYIIALAVVDLVTCVAVVPSTIYMEYVEFRIGDDVACKLYQFAITSNIPFSALIMVAIAVERYICICHPWARLTVTAGGAKVIVFGLAVFSAGLGVCVALMHGVYHILPAADLVGSSYVTTVADAAVNCSVGNGSWNVDFGSSRLHRVGVSRQNVDYSDGYENCSSTSGWTPSTYVGGTIDDEGDFAILNTGYCGNNTLIVSQRFQSNYLEFHTWMYSLCLLCVLVLYALIFRSVMTHRARRQKLKSSSLVLVLNSLAAANRLPAVDRIDGGGGGGAEESRPSFGDECRNEPDSTIGGGGGRRVANMSRARNRLANIRTAVMLFVVTVVFVVSFCPAFLMALQLIKYNMVLFYLYFVNNVANPVIYSFMNQKFRDELKSLFC